MIEWQGIQITIDENDLLQQENECQNNRKQLHDNIYRKHTGNSVC